MNFTPYIIAWVVLAAAVSGLALYRKLTMLHQEDELIHLAAGEEKLIPHQVALTEKMNVIDRWGETLTIMTVVSGLLLGAVWLYEALLRTEVLR